MNQIAMRLMILLFLSLTAQGSEDKKIEEQSIDNQAIETVQTNEIITNSKSYEMVKTKNRSNEVDLESEEKSEDKKELDLVEDWLETLPKIEDDSKAAEFIDKISPMAVIIAKEKGLYPSVMIAQAGLESGWGSSALALKYNNLMGTKGAWRGNEVTMKTNEEVAGKDVQIRAGFSVYNSWADSLNHYGKMLRDGLDWDDDFYKGTWRENTDNYKDATAYLVGRYATDSSYASKLNATIEKYDLNKFDKIEVIDFDYEEFLVEATVEI